MRECPKCGSRPVTGDACARCGLAVARMDAFVAADDVPAELAAAWDACVRAWDDPAAHDRVAGLALASERFPWLARRYRTVLRDRPDDAIAGERVQRIGRMAEAAMRATAAPVRAAPARRTGAYAIMLVVALLVAVSMVYAVRVIAARRSTVETTGARTPATPVRPVKPPAAKIPAPPPLPQGTIESPSPGR